MNIKQLREALADFPEEMEVRIHLDSNTGYIKDIVEIPWTDPSAEDDENYLLILSHYELT